MYTAKTGLYAKGRLKTGEMNRTEAAYRDHLEAEKRAGRILEFWFEHIKLKIADNACGYCLKSLPHQQHAALSPRFP